MASAEQQEQLTLNEEDPYKSKGHIELRIENFSGFVQERLYMYSYCEWRSEPVYVRGVPWKIFATLNGKRQTKQTISYWLQCHQTERLGYSVNAKIKVLAQKEGSVDHIVHEVKEARIYGVGYYLNFEKLMNPDNGWYDEQTDSIVLAVDLTANRDDDKSDEYVVFAENELKLNTDTSISMQIGRLGWQINFDSRTCTKPLVFSCEDVAEGRVDNVLLEIVGYRRDPKSVAYSPFPSSGPYPVRPMYRHLFTREDNSLMVKIPGGRAFDNILFTVRVLKPRSQFPDFTKPTTRVGRFSADVQLRVGDQQFHVNKQLLSTLSPFFDRMFNGLFGPATGLGTNMHSPELFHHFLLVMCVNEVLPNSINVAALFKLADYYDAEIVREKCDQHLRMAREMPMDKRVLLARDHGSKETRDLLAIESVNLAKSRRRS